MSAEPAGRHLAIRLVADATRITSVTLARKTVDVAAILPGKPARLAPGLLASLLPVCAMAHRAAALGALEDAGLPFEGDRRALAMAVAAERAVNGIWRLGVDGAAALGLPARMATVARARAALRDIAEGRDPGHAAAMLDDAVAAVSDIAAALAAAAAPFGGEACACAARAAEDPVIALAALDDLRFGRLDPSAGFGAQGEVETSRGRLCHRAVLDGASIRHWEIETPTDRMAAPGGMVERLLTGLGHNGRPLSTARLMVALIDPCETVGITVGEASAHA